ncbi:MAG: hypothetical protein AAF283_00005, partial [Cyanobacteria bacterium P01_A01_bin.70]
MGEQEAQVGSNDRVEARLREIDGIQDPSEKVKALVKLASEMLPSRSEVQHQALDAAQAIQSEDYRRDALMAIAPQLSEATPELLKQALDAAQAIQSEDYRRDALMAIAPQLSEV